MQDDASESLIGRLGLLVESRFVRAILVALIILSVLPYPEIERTFRPIFLLAFGAELAVRVPLLIQRWKRHRVGLGALLYLVVDAAAFVSFLPLEEWFPGRFEWLVVMRLSRLAVLLRFAKELAADLYSILTRREQLQQFGLVSVAVAALAFVSAVILSQLRIEHDYDNSPLPDGFWDRAWWSFRQLESADNLVQNLHVHPLVGVLSLALTVIGVFIISFIIGIGANVVEQVVRAERRRVVGYRGHTVVIGPIAESEVLVREFVRIYSKNRRDFRDQLQKLGRWLLRGGEAPRPWRLPRMALLGPDPEPPPVLLEPGMRWVVYRQGDPADGEALERIGAGRAKRAVLLGDRGAHEDADAITVASLAALRDINPHAHVFLELLHSRSFSTLRTLGEGTRTFPLDMPWFLGLFILQHLVVPGVERLYQLLLTADGSELYSHVYVSSAELEAIAQHAGPDGTLAFEDLAALAEAHHVVLIGVFLGTSQPVADEHDLVPVDDLVAWLNPLVEPREPRVAALGGRAGRVPVKHLRGVIGVSENYQPLRTFARALAHRPRSQPHADGARAALEPAEGEAWITAPIEGAAAGARLAIAPPRPAPRRILVVGQAEPITSFTLRLAQLTEAHVVVAASGNGAGVHALRRALARGGVEMEPDGTAALGGGGRFSLRAPAHGDAMDAALEEMSQDPAVEAVVLLSDRDARDPDARTGLYLMRLAEHLLRRDDPPPHVLAELSSLAKGERARREVERAFERAGRAPPRVTLVSTEQVRNYFMVHSAFVPGISDVYGELLGERGDDIVRLPIEHDAPVSMRHVRRVLAARGIIALGFELADGAVELNPPPEARFTNVRGVFAIADPPATDRGRRRARGLSRDRP